MGSVAVLDLDETLIYACSRKDCGNYDDLLWSAVCLIASRRCAEQNIPCFYTEIYFVFVRPKAVETLQYFRKNFDFLIIFTAGNETHAKFIRQKLFEEAAAVSVDFVFNRESCGKFSSTTNATQATITPYQKNLCHIREVFEQSASDEQKKRINWQDCLFVEDYSFNAITNCSETLIVPKFDYPVLFSLLKKDISAEIDITEAANDDVLLRLVQFIEKKKELEPHVLWHMIDKRFAMFI